MLKRVFNYTDFRGVPRTEEAFFYLNESELMELSLTPEGGFDALVKRIIETHDGKTIVETFREIILKSYGKKSPDGRQFIKSKELSTEFSQTPMFNELLMEIVMNADKAAEFCTKIIPRSDSNIAANARKAMAKVDMKKKLGRTLPADFYAPISAPGYVEEVMGEVPTTVEEIVGEDGQEAQQIEVEAAPVPIPQEAPQSQPPVYQYPAPSVQTQMVPGAPPVISQA